MLVGRSGESNQVKASIQPHNYRLYFDFYKGKSFNPNRRLTNGVEYKTLNYGSEHFFKNYKDCNFKIRKDSIEVTNKIDHKDWYDVSKSLAHSEIFKIINNKNQETLEVLKDFIRYFGGTSKFILLNFFCEIKVKNEKFIDRIPIKLSFHTPIVKHLYKEQSVEYIGSNSVDNTIRYLENSALNDFAPELVKVLKDINNKIEPTEQQFIQDIIEDIEEDFKGFDWLKENINSVEDGIKYKDSIERLEDDLKMDLAIILQAKLW